MARDVYYGIAMNVHATAVPESVLAFDTKQFRRPWALPSKYIQHKHELAKQVLFFLKVLVDRVNVPSL